MGGQPIFHFGVDSRYLAAPARSAAADDFAQSERGQG
jgi:hypothetical protein